MNLTDVTRTYFEKLAQVSPPEEAARYKALFDSSKTEAAQEYFRKNNIEVNSMLRTSISPNIITGGFKSNVIPSEAEATLDIRAIPGEDMDKFKAMMEKHMTKEMDLEGNQRLDWFFNEYVYGTALPTYQFQYKFDKDANGEVGFNFTVTQSGVDDKFRMLVPIYIELTDGRTVFVGRARLTGNASVERKVPIKGIKDIPKRALVNYYDDVLASN